MAKVSELARLIVHQIHGIPNDVDYHEDTPLTMKLGEEVVKMEDALQDAIEEVIEDKASEGRLARIG